MSVEETLFAYLGAGERGGGGNIKYRCPFHGGGAEKSASFYVHAETGLAFCHACNQGWAFPALLQALGADWRIVEAASLIIKDVPRKKKRTAAYVGLADAALLPEATTAATLHCPEELLAAGFDMDLLLRNEVGYDEENACPLYHLRDHLGRLMGVSGRWADGYYVYGKQQLAHLVDLDFLHGYRPPNKSSMLWNLHRVYPRRFHGVASGPLVVTEGFKACMWVQRAGIEDTTALMGSYLSDDQAILIERVTDEVVFFLDDDPAGHKGTARGVDVMKRSCRVRVARYPEHDRKKMQPDDLPLDFVREIIERAPYYYQR